VEAEVARGGDALAVAVDDELLVEERHGDGFVGQVVAVGDGVPVVRKDVPVGGGKS
jgi:hypothetical protein